MMRRRGRDGKAERNREQNRQQSTGKPPISTQPYDKKKWKQQIILLFDAQRPGVGKGVELRSWRKIIIGGGSENKITETEEGGETCSLTGTAQIGIGDEQNRSERRDQ